MAGGVISSGGLNKKDNSSSFKYKAPTSPKQGTTISHESHDIEKQTNKASTVTENSFISGGSGVLTLSQRYGLKVDQAEEIEVRVKHGKVLLSS